MSSLDDILAGLGPALSGEDKRKLDEELKRSASLREALNAERAKCARLADRCTELADEVYQLRLHAPDNQPKTSVTP